MAIENNEKLTFYDEESDLDICITARRRSTNQPVIPEGQFILDRVLKLRALHAKEDELRTNRKDSFMWCNYKRDQLLDLGIQQANIFRLFYLATYMNYDNILTSYKGNILTMSKLNDDMGLSKRAALNMWNELSEYGLITRTNDGLLVNDALFSKGRMQKDNSHMRVYSDSIRAFYKGCATARDHKHAGCIFMLLPFAEYHTNILMHDNKPMTMGQICGVLGYNETYADRLKKAFLSFKINDHPVMEYTKECFKIYKNLYYSDKLIYMED